LCFAFLASLIPELNDGRARFVTVPSAHFVIFHLFAKAFTPDDPAHLISVKVVLLIQGLRQTSQLSVLILQKL